MLSSAGFTRTRRTRRRKPSIAPRVIDCHQPAEGWVRTRPRELVKHIGIGRGDVRDEAAGVWEIEEGEVPVFGPSSTPAKSGGSTSPRWRRIVWLCESDDRLVVGVFQGFVPKLRNRSGEAFPRTMNTILILEEATRSGSGQRGAPLPGGAFWTGFGSATLVCAPDPSSADAAGAVLGSASSRRTVEQSLNPDELFLVLQKGRLFQLEHPKARVLLDKGRFLVVHLPRDQQEKVHPSQAPCYCVRPLPRNEAVFEARDRIAGRVPVPAVQAFVDRIEIERFRADVMRLAEMHTRHLFSELYRDAVELARARLEELGFVRAREVVVGTKTTLNVIADRVGASANGRSLVVIGAHLDSVNLNGNNASRAPGADDNASGSAGVLEIARVLRDYCGRHDLRLILFGGEEQGLHGSRQLVAGLPAVEKS